MQRSLFFVDVPAPSAAAAAARSSYKKSLSEEPPYPPAGKPDKGKGREVARSLEEENDAFLSGADWPHDSGAAPSASTSNVGEGTSVILESVNGNGDVTMASSDGFEVDTGSARQASRSTSAQLAMNGSYMQDSGLLEPYNDNMIRSSSRSSSAKSDMPLARRVRLVKAGDRVEDHVQQDYEELDKLPIDVDIAKILARNLLEDGTCEYIVKLDDDRKVKVRSILHSQVKCPEIVYARS